MVRAVAVFAVIHARTCQLQLTKTDAQLGYASERPICERAQFRGEERRLEGDSATTSTARGKLLAS